MSTEENKNVVRKYMEVGVNQANVAETYKLFAPNFAFHFPGAPAPMDREGWKQMTLMFASAFPGQATTVNALLAEGDLVAARFTFRGRNTGAFQGIPASGKEATFTGMAHWRLEHGLIAEHWVEIDAMGLMQQLGAIPAPAGR